MTYLKLHDSEIVLRGGNLHKFPPAASEAGFSMSKGGTHASRTMMLSELQLLMQAAREPTSVDEYRSAIIDDNVLLKNTSSTREKSFRHLRELYALDPAVPIFRVLHELWFTAPEAQPMLAVLSSAARDTLFRTTADFILSVPYGETVTADQITDAFQSARNGQLNEQTAGKLGRNAASSWTQSGHVTGHSRKIRTQAALHPASTAFALYLGYLAGIRGVNLFTSLWARILDHPENRVRDSVLSAAQRGWMDYRSAGGITDIAFSYFDELQSGRTA